MIKEYFLNYEAMNNDFTIALGQPESRSSIHGAHDEGRIARSLWPTPGRRSHDRRPRRNGSSATSTATPSWSPTATAWPTSTSTQLLAFHRGHGKLATVTGVRPRLPLRRARHRLQTAAWSVRREARQGDGWINAGFFVFHRRVFDYLDGGRRLRSWNASRWSAWPPTANSWSLPPRGLLPRDGHLPRIRGAQQDLGHRPGPVEGLVRARAAHVRTTFAGPIGVPHRPYRLQGLVAGPLAAPAGRQRDRLRPARRRPSPATSAARRVAILLAIMTGDIRDARDAEAGVRRRAARTWFSTSPPRRSSGNATRSRARPSTSTSWARSACWMRAGMRPVRARS